MDAIKMHRALPETLTVVLTRAKMQKKSTELFFYKIIKRINEKNINSPKFADMKTILLKALESAGASTELLKCFKDSVCTNQEVISVARLPFGDVKRVVYSITSKETGVDEVELEITDSKVQKRALNLPEDLSLLNFIIGEAFNTCYVKKGATQYISHEGEKVTRDVEKFVTVSPSAVLVRESELHLQLGLRWSLSTAGDTWWREFMNWKSTKDTEKARKEEKIRLKNVKTLHRPIGYDYVGYKILKVTDAVAGDVLSEKVNKTYCQYFQERYNFTLDPKCPIFKCRRTGTTTVVKYPAQMLQPLFVFDLKAIPAQLCAMYPALRFKLAEGLLNEIKKSNVGKYMQKFGLWCSTSLEKLQVSRKSNILPCPKVYLPNGKVINASEYPEQLGFIKELTGGQMRQEEAKRTLLCGNANKSAPVIKECQTIGLKMPTGNTDINRVKEGKEVYLFNTNRDDEYISTKLKCAEKGVISQCFKKDLMGVIPRMIALQIAAKMSMMNFRFNAREVALSFAKHDLIIVGIDIGVHNRRADVSQRLLTCTSFRVRNGDAWETFCDHTWVNIRAKSGKDVTFTRVNEEIIRFMKSMKQHWKVNEAQEGVLLLCSSPCAVGELFGLMPGKSECNKVFPKWKISVVASQARSDTNIAWDPQNNGKTEDFRNVPRGLLIEEQLTICGTVNGDANGLTFTRGFRLCSANCTLGQARTLLYLIKEQDTELANRDLQLLLYALCFVYQNFPGSLPIPLPMKAAMEYNRKFTPLHACKRLHADLRPTMHYL